MNPRGLVRVIGGSEEEALRYSICTVVNNPTEYAGMVESFVAAGFDPAFCEFLCCDNSTCNRMDAFEAYNAFLGAARGRYIILCHQDILLVFDDIERLEACIEELDQTDPSWGLLGNAGGVGYGQVAIRITHGDGVETCPDALPKKVQSLDENFIVVKRSANLCVSHDLFGWHFYGTDLCQMAQRAGLSAWVVDFHLLHKSAGNFNASFYEAAVRIAEKYRFTHPPGYIQTTCTLLPTGNSQWHHDHAWFYRYMQLKNLVVQTKDAAWERKQIMQRLGLVAFSVQLAAHFGGVAWREHVVLGRARFLRLRALRRYGGSGRAWRQEMDDLRSALGVGGFAMQWLLYKTLAPFCQVRRSVAKRLAQRDPSAPATAEHRSGKSTLRVPLPRPRIAFLTAANPRDRSVRSGVFFHMLRALERSCGEVIPLGPAEPELSLLERLSLRVLGALAARRAGASNYNIQYSVAYARSWGRVFRELLRLAQADVIFAPNASVEIACLKTSVPIVYASDGTMRLLSSHCPEPSKMANAREGDWLERRAIQRANVLVYRSDWAARSAMEDYGADAARVFTLPSGSGFEDVPAAESVTGRLPEGVCRLLFVGVDWERTGGAIVLQTVHALNESGLPSELVLVGGTPPPGTSLSHVRLVPFLDCNNSQERSLLADHFASAHFLLMPTQADTFFGGVCDASAFGLPSLVADTGGVSALITEGVNGHMLPLNAGAADYAALIAEIWKDAPRYKRLQEQSRQLYENRLNWDFWGKRMAEILNESISVAPMRFGP